MESNNNDLKKQPDFFQDFPAERVAKLTSPNWLVPIHTPAERQLTEILFRVERGIHWTNEDQHQVFLAANLLHCIYIGYNYDRLEDPIRREILRSAVERLWADWGGRVYQIITSD